MTDAYTRLDAIRAAHKAMGVLLEGIDWMLYEKCADCGHRFIEHRKSYLTGDGDGCWPCAHEDCGCEDFDGTGERLLERRAA